MTIAAPAPPLAIPADARYALMRLWAPYRLGAREPRMPHHSTLAVLLALHRRPHYGAELTSIAGDVPRMVARLVARGLIESRAEVGDPHELGRPLRVYWRLTRRGWALAGMVRRLVPAMAGAVTT